MRKFFLPVLRNLVLIATIFYLQCKAQNLGVTKESQNIVLLDLQEIQIGCMDFKYFSDELIINSEEDYVNFLDYRAPHPDCSDYQLPGIDFSKKTLLGYKTVAGGCQEPEYTRTVSCNNKTKTCIYSISIKQNGLCKKGWPSMNWIIVSKITNDFKVAFNVNTTSSN